MTRILRSNPAQLARLIVITARPGLALRTQRALLTAGHQAEVATTLRRGLAILRQRPPDGIVLDSEARSTQMGDYDALISAAHEAQVALIVLGRPTRAEPTLLTPEIRGRAPLVSASPLADALVGVLRSHGLSADAATGQTYGGLVECCTTR